MKSFSKILLIIITLLIAGPLESWAQKFEITADKTTVSQNERFQVYLTFEGADAASLQSFRPPSFRGFSILSGPNQSSSYQSINGKVAASITYSYLLVPPNTGTITITTAAVKFKGTEYKTKPLTINVIKAASQPQQKSSNQTLTNEELKENVFIIAQADKRKAIKGEQVSVAYKLFTSLNISSPQISKLPTYQGFWAEELERVNNIRFNIEMYKGKRYRSATLKRVALFPTRSGKLTVTPFELEIPVIVKKRRSANDPFNDFFNDSFFGRTETVQFLAKSNKITIDVSPLPSANKPESFSGAVGEYNFKAELDKSNVETNEAITLKLTVSGKGNIELLEMPKVVLPPGFEQYDPKTSKIINNKSIISGRKIVEYLIVPRIPGVKEIQTIKFSYYNSRQKKYIEIISPKFSINVKKGANDFGPVAGGFSKEDVKLLSQDIRFIKTSDFKLSRKESGGLIKNWFWASLVFPLLILIGFVGIKKRQDKLSGNVQLMKFKKAEKIARNRLKNAKKALSANDLILFYNEVSQALYGYLEGKLSLQKSEFTIDKVLNLLHENKVDEDLLNKVKDILEKCEFARYSPQAQTEEAAEKLYEETVASIVKLESSVKK